MPIYDSAPETEKHIEQVQKLLFDVLVKIGKASSLHDASKLGPPEKECYDLYTPILREMSYGSDEYKRTLENMGHALAHHYRVNRHHPEHFENGISGMTLIDLLEMLADWKAATLRHDDGDIMKSLEINRERFGITEQLAQILQNTVAFMNWNKPQEVENENPA
jgi:hypothetical protein